MSRVRPAMRDGSVIAAADRAERRSRGEDPFADKVPAPLDTTPEKYKGGKRRRKPKSNQVRHPTRKRPVARGVVDPRKPGYRQAIIRLSDEMFDAVAARAERDGVSFAEQVRVFCEWGLEAEEEDEAPRR